MEGGILKSNKNVFWEALIITIFIFGIGILIGIFLENSRADKISDIYLKSEIDLLDVKIQSEILSIRDLNCDKAIEENIKFGDKIYEDAKLLQRYEEASRITEYLREQHRRYDLLRTLFWLNSIKIKEKCGKEFDTLVYLYDYSSENQEEKSKQEVFSRFLEELKAEKGNELLLIPIAKNMNLSSLDLMIDNFDISKTSIIVNEDLVISEINELKKINDYVKSQK